MAASSSSHLLKTVAADMMVYGGEAQRYFDYLPVDGCMDADMGELKNYVTKDVTYTDISVPGINYQGSSLTLDGHIGFNIYFNDAAKDMNDHTLMAVVSYTDHYGRSKEAYVNEMEFIRPEGKDQYGIRVDGIVLADVKTLVHVTVYDENQTKVAETSDSIESYLARLGSMGRDVMADSIMKLAISSRAYFHRGI